MISWLDSATKGVIIMVVYHSSKSALEWSESREVHCAIDPFDHRESPRWARPGWCEPQVGQSNEPPDGAPPTITINNEPDSLSSPGERVADHRNPLGYPSPAHFQRDDGVRLDMT